MPIKKKGESRNDYVQRCMSDPEVKKKKPGQSERLGYCEGLYTWKKKKNQSKGSTEEPSWDDNDLGIITFLP